MRYQPINTLAAVIFAIFLCVSSATRVIIKINEEPGASITSPPHQQHGNQKTSPSVSTHGPVHLNPDNLHNIELSFGAMLRIASFSGHCFSQTSDPNYVYTLCPYFNMTRLHLNISAVIPKHSPTSNMSESLGHWNAWAPNKQMLYSGGAECQGKNKSMQTEISFRCGATNLLFPVIESPPCHFSAVMESPFVCNQQLVASDSPMLSEMRSVNLQLLMYQDVSTFSRSLLHCIMAVTGIHDALTTEECRIFLQTLRDTVQSDLQFLSINTTDTRVHLYDSVSIPSMSQDVPKHPPTSIPLSDSKILPTTPYEPTLSLIKPTVLVAQTVKVHQSLELDLNLVQDIDVANTPQESAAVVPSDNPSFSEVPAQDGINTNTVPESSFLSTDSADLTTTAVLTDF